MSILVIGVMIVGLAAAVAYPFLLPSKEGCGPENTESRDRLEREKAIALMAIREADLDRAMGKLSDDDYGTLRLQYEERAVHALTALDELTAQSPPAPAVAGDAPGGPARFCTGCGRGFRSDERFCPACGLARTSIR